jgi:diaminohydroxyphosphoribosylaminopyrimidine deaminase/5-amino-6-(5-phosphoribosylamino)uracil reductase
MMDDLTAMRRALALAQEALGAAAPNPAVGCVIVKDGEVIAEAATGSGGRPHAEEAALAALGGRADGATIYVTLEPCAHESARGPACADGISKSGAARCVIACGDPDPRTAGAGIARIRAAGVEVGQGICEAEALALNAGFFRRLATGRPIAQLSADLKGFDAEFRLGVGESFEQALDRMGREGLTRVRVRPGSPLEEALRSRGLLD